MEMGLAAAIDFAGGRVGHGEIRLLELIDETGSVAAGCATARSCRRASPLGGRLNTTFREPVVDPSTTSTAAARA